jgi:hypothetical protein
MSFDRRLYPATDQPLPSADDRSYSKYHTREDEGLRLRNQLDDIEPYLSERSNDLARYHNTPAHTSNDSPWSHINPHSINANDVDIDPPYSYYDINQQHTEHLLNASGVTLSDNAAWRQTSVVTIDPEWDLLFPDTRQDTHWAALNRDAAQIQNPEHPWSSYVGAQSGQPYPVSMYESSFSATPGLALQLGNDEEFGPFGHTRRMAMSASECSSVATYEPSSGTVLRCAAEGCTAIFSGRYCKGNLARHKRLNHSHGRVYMCEDDDCDRVFRRQDARIKHYRKCHPQLTSGPAFSRKSHRIQSDYDVGSNTREAGAAILESQSSMPPLQYTDSGTVYMDTTPSRPMIVTSGPSTEALRKDGESVQCDICQKEFNRVPELRRHKDSVHKLNPPQYFCEVPGCGRASRPFPRKDKLADHTARVHGHSTTSEALKHGEEVSEATHRCDHEGCKREFDQRADLLRHQRTHTDESERPHKCAQCEKSFLYPKDLKRHQATHLDSKDDDKPSFHCEVASCEYGPGKQGFSRKDGMIRHMRRFHPEVIVEKEEV